MDAFSDNSSQSSFTTTSTDPRKLVTMLDTIATNPSDMFKVGDDSCNYCLWQLLGYSVSQSEKLKGIRLRDPCTHILHMHCIHVHVGGFTSRPRASCTAGWS